MHRITRTATALTAIALAAPAAAQAHVTLQPSEATAGSYTVENVRVPNETEDATTTKVAVQLPDGFASVSYEAVPGWSAEVVKTKLATPVKTDDGELDEQVAEITFTAADGKGIAPGQFQDFPLSVKIPDAAGTLTFKAVQTYDDGEVARWIGAPDTDKPAPQITVAAATAAEAGGHHDAGKAQETVLATPAAAAVPADDDGTDGLSVAALVVGGLGLLTGLAALITTRRRPARA